MGVQIIFIAAFVLLLAGLICLKKTSEKLSFLRSAVICFITELCLGAVLGGVYTLVKIPVGLLSMGIGFFVFAVLAWGFVFFRREMQSYTVYATDIYAFSVITIFFVYLFLRVFTSEIAIVYKNSDPGTHYGLALKVLQTGKLGRMYFTELYNSLVMEMLQPLLKEITLYKAFILSDTFFNYVNLLMFYILLSTILKSKLLKAVSPFICIFYFLGWPFYSYVAGGYVYFGVGVTLFSYTVYLLLLLKESREAWKDKLLFAMLALGIFGVTVCYMLFTPVLCLVIVVCLLYLLRERKITIPKALLLKVIGIVLTLGIILFCICFFGYFKGDIGRILTSLRIEGGIHRELYKDFLFLLPPVIFMGWHYYKQKKVDFLFLSWTVIAGVTVIVFFVYLFGAISGYYYYKLYYLNWVFLWLVCAEAAEYFVRQNKVMLYAYGIPVITAVILTFLGTDRYLIKRDMINASSPTLFPIYGVTMDYIQNSEETEEMDGLRSISLYINENFEKTQAGIPFICSIDKFNYPVWYRDFTGYSSKLADRGNDSSIPRYVGNILEQLEQEGCVYFIIIKTADCYTENEALFEQYEAVYDNGYYGIYKMQ